MKSKILAKLQHHFPQVEEVVDADEGITVTVTKRDSFTGRIKKPENCALAKACIRELEADGAIINVAYSYIITGKTATRYQTSVSVAREITSFDRNAGFEPGKYLLSKVKPSAKLGKRNGTDGTGPAHQQRAPWKMPRRIHRHSTENIRITEK